MVPCTTFSPRPHAALINTTRSKPVSVSMENTTPAPARSERTICCTQRNHRSKIVRGKEVPVTVSSDGKAGWYFDVVTPEIPHHLAKGGILTAHGGHVV